MVQSKLKILSQTSAMTVKRQLCKGDFLCDLIDLDFFLGKNRLKLQNHGLLRL